MNIVKLLRSSNHEAISVYTYFPGYLFVTFSLLLMTFNLLFILFGGRGKEYVMEVVLTPKTSRTCLDLGEGPCDYLSCDTYILFEILKLDNFDLTG